MCGIELHAPVACVRGDGVVPRVVELGAVDVSEKVLAVFLRVDAGGLGRDEIVLADRDLDPAVDVSERRGSSLHDEFYVADQRGLSRRRLEDPGDCGGRPYDLAGASVDGDDG